MASQIANTIVTGNTYPVREQIKALGGRWDAPNRRWLVPAAVAEQARALVASAGPAQPSSYARSYTPRARRTGCRCGSVEGQIRASDCWQCRHDAE